jgi:signal transduction histidine kinase
LLLTIQFIACSANAQQPYTLVHYDEKILPQTSIGNIQQDENGYLWMNTQYGIVRFDGENVRVFTTNNLQGLTSNRIRLCAKGLDNAVYFVDENNVVVKVKSPNQFETIATANCIKEFKIPLYSRECNNDYSYLSFDKKVPYKVFVDSLKFDLTREFLKSYAVGKSEGYLFYWDLQQKLRLCYYDGKNYTSEIQSNQFKAQHTFKLNNFVFCQASSLKAILLDKTKQKKIVNVTGLPNYFTHIFHQESPVLFSNETGVFLYASGKLYQYEFDGNSIVATLVFEGLPCDGVTNVMRERTTGDFFISTKSTGFYRVKKKRFSVVNLTGSGETSAANLNLNNNIVYALTAWDNEHIFFNGYITPVRGGGISRNFDPGNKGRFNYYFSYTKDSGHVWLNFDDGIQSFNKTTGRYVPIVKILNPKKAMELSNGTTIIVAGDRIVSIKDNQITELFRDDTIKFTSTEKVTEDCLIIGSDNGLYYFYLKEKKLQPVKYKMALKVRFIFKDKSERLWFTTYGQGLFYLSGNSIVSMPADPAGYLNIAHSIVEDNRGDFWVPTNHGLFKLGYASLLSIIQGQKDKLYYTYYDKTDGFNTNEFNGGCFPSGLYQKETGLVFFPSMNGVVRFNPDSIPNVISSNRIYLDEVVVNDTGHLYNVTDKYFFTKQTSSLRMNFSSPGYDHPENIIYSYALSNNPEYWKDVEKNGSITLSNLPGGNYTVLIKKEGATSSGIVTSFNFEIEKKFSETLLFKLLLLALVVALVYLYFRARLYYLNTERTRLEKLVAVKTANQLKLIDQLTESITRQTAAQKELEQMIAHKENVIAVLIHDIKSPLYFLSTVASLLNKGIETNASEKNKEIVTEIAGSLDRLYLFTQDFTTWLNASRPGQIQKNKVVDLEVIVAEVLDVYKEIIDKKHIYISLEVTNAMVYGDELMIKSVIRNLIDNAVKNSTNGNIVIDIASGINEQLCEIAIADEGKGMTEEQIASLNYYFQNNTDELPFSNSGFGHKIIKDFLHKLGGTIQYKQNGSTGTIVTVGFPVQDLIVEMKKVAGMQI